MWSHANGHPARVSGMQNLRPRPKSDGEELDPLCAVKEYESSCRTPHDSKRCNVRRLAWIRSVERSGGRGKKKAAAKCRIHQPAPRGGSMRK